MEKYYCKKCEFATKYSQNFKVHIASSKHANNHNSTEINDHKNMLIKKFKCVVYECKICNKIYKSKQYRDAHYNKCMHKHNEIHHIIINNKNNNDEKTRDDSSKFVVEKYMEHQSDILNKVLELANKNAEVANKNAEIAIESTSITKKSMNILNYANKNLTSGEPLIKLDEQGAYELIGYEKPMKKIPYKEYDKYVKQCIYKCHHDKFSEYIGNLIVSHYKPTDKTKANILASDTSRLSFVILQGVDKEINESGKEWIGDKSGKRFKFFILEPILCAVKTSLDIYTQLSLERQNKETNVEKSMKQFSILTDCAKLKRDIENDKFTHQIIKYVAPSFHFDSFI
jgi:hypothetical protein